MTVKLAHKQKKKKPLLGLLAPLLLTWPTCMRGKKVSIHVEPYGEIESEKLSSLNEHSGPSQLLLVVSQTKVTDDSPTTNTSQANALT